MRRVVVKSAPPRPRAPKPPPREEPKNASVVEQQPEPRVIVPPDQLTLTPKELEEDMTRVLTANNPQLVSNPVAYSFVEREFRPLPSAADEHAAVAFAQDGSLAHADSEAAAAQRAYEKAYRDALEVKRRERQRAAEDGAAAGAGVGGVGGGDLPSAPAAAAVVDGGADGGGGVGDDDGDDSNAGTAPTAAAATTATTTDAAAADDELLQRNQFTHTERAAQTFAPGTRERGAATADVETRESSGTMSQWRLHDAYMRQLTVAAAAAAAASKSASSAGGGASATTTARRRGPGASAASASSSTGTDTGGSSGNPLHSPSLAAALATLERMAVQNAEDEVFADYAFWEDASDAFKADGSGTLLPLWKFDDAAGNPKRKGVTAVAWSRLYGDLFAVGYGRFDFLRQGSGGLALYSLKNVATPLRAYPLDATALAVAFHPQHPAVVGVGCYDGSVRVFDARRPEATPVYSSSVASAGGGSGARRAPGGGSDPVWDVAWQHQRSPGDPLALLSVGADGRVTRWVLTLAGLRMEPVAALALPRPPSGAVGGSSSSSSEGVAALSASGSSSGSGGGLWQTSDGSSLSGSLTSSVTPGASVADGDGATRAALVPGTGVPLATCTCFDFSPFDRALCLVGTEEGRVYRCSTEYAAPAPVAPVSGGGTGTSSGGSSSSSDVVVYEGHTLGVYAVRWNAYHPRVFLTASADWTVKLWDTSHPARPVYTFDLGSPVGDVAWAPYSSTTFAAVTDDGRAHVFDLSVDHHGPLCEQKVVKKAKATRLAFNRRHPHVLLVGDSAGAVTSLKLSPNLRRVAPITAAAVAAAGGASAKKGHAQLQPPPASREEVEVRRLDALLALSDARVTLVTPVPGREAGRGGAGSGARGKGGEDGGGGATASGGSESSAGGGDKGATPA